MKQFLVGSTYFFSCYSDFASKDVDYLQFEINPKEYTYKMQITGKGKCIFKWRKMSANSYVMHMLSSKLPMELGKFLVKEVCEEIRFTIEHLKRLKPIVDKLDEKHLYEKVIYESYIENNDFVLTEEQRLKAYNVYREARQ